MTTDNAHAMAALHYLAAAAATDHAVTHLHPALDTGAVPGYLNDAARLTFVVDELLDLAVACEELALMTAADFEVVPA